MPRQELTDEQQAVLLGLYRIVQEKSSTLAGALPGGAGTAKIRPPLDRAVGAIVAAAQRCKALGLR
jgi:hypothetical protein